jgi:hypothetical protein
MVAMLAPSDDDKVAVEDDDVVKEAYERFESCKDFQGNEDDKARDDIKFANADPLNMWQWDPDVLERRAGENGEDDLPCLTINVTRVHNDLIINSMSKNRYGVKIKPTGGVATYESAKIFQSLVNRIESISKASAHYRKVAEHQVDGGIGYIIISTDYVSERSFNQEIYLRAARDPTGVYLDPWAKEPDGSDARFGFEFERMSRKEFNRKHKKWKGAVAAAPLGQAMELWITDKEIVLCKYWRKNEQPDTLIGFKDDDGKETLKLASEIREESGQDILDQLLEDIENGVIDGQTRAVSRDNVEWKLIAGTTIVDEGEWAGKYIPICRCPGREIVIDGTLDRKGHTRPLINAQHMLNYNASVSVEAAATAVKSQWLGPARAFEGQEQWKSANLKRYAALAYTDIDEEASGEDRRIDKPERIDPAQVVPAYQAGMQDAERQMMMISGQFQAQMGENDTQSAASGKAIGERQQQGDTATYHFPEHQSDMLRFIGVQLIDLIPKIYDTERMLQVEGDGDEKHWIKIDPSLSDPMKVIQESKDDEEATRLLFNPAVGEYECVSDPGPSYATQRQEAWSAFAMIMQQSQWVAACASDLLMKVGDFPGAEELGERLRKEIKATKPYLFDDGAPPQLAEAQQQLQRLQALNVELMQKLAHRDMALKGRDERRDIEGFRAETDRMSAMVEAIAKMVLTPGEREQMQHEIALKSHEAILANITSANQAAIDAQSDQQSGAPQAGGGQ